MKRIHSSERRRKNQSGELIIEFGLYMLFMVPILAGVFTLGMGLVKAVEAGEVCRNANVLTVRQINMADPNNQKLLVRTARDLGMANADWSPNPNGKGIVVISKVVRVGELECSQVTKNDANHTPDPRKGNPTDCPNFDQYVIAQRIVIGNRTYFRTSIGSPSSPTDSQGNISANDIALTPGNRATGFPPVNTACVADGTMPPDNGLVCLESSKFAYVTESVFDVSELNIFSILPAPLIYSRNVS